MATGLSFLQRTSLRGITMHPTARQVLVDSFEATSILSVGMANLMTKHICPFSNKHITRTMLEIKDSRGMLLSVLFYFDALKTHTLAHLLAHVGDSVACDCIFYWAFLKFPIDETDRVMLKNAARDEMLPEHNRRVLFEALNKLD